MQPCRPPRTGEGLTMSWPPGLCQQTELPPPAAALPRCLSELSPHSSSSWHLLAPRGFPCPGLSAAPGKGAPSLKGQGMPSSLDVPICSQPVAASSAASVSRFLTVPCPASARGAMGRQNDEFQCFSLRLCYWDKTSQINTNKTKPDVAAHWNGERSTDGESRERPWR